MAELWSNNMLSEEQRNKIKYATNFRVQKEHMKQFDDELRFFIEMALHTKKKERLFEAFLLFLFGQG
jgi:hypothetical protein